MSDKKPRPKLKPSQSTNWSWPRLISINAAAEKPKINAHPTQVLKKQSSSAAPSLRGQKQVMSQVGEEEEPQQQQLESVVSPGGSVLGTPVERKEQLEAKMSPVVSSRGSVLMLAEEVVVDPLELSEGKGEEGMDEAVEDGGERECVEGNHELGEEDEGHLADDESDGGEAGEGAYSGIEADDLHDHAGTHLPDRGALNGMKDAADQDAKEGPRECADSCKCPEPCACVKPCLCPEGDTSPEKRDEILPATPTITPTINRCISIEEPSKPLPPPRIFIQRASNTSSDADPISMPAPFPTPQSRSIDSILAEERRMSGGLTQQDHETIVQSIAKEMEAVTPQPSTIRPLSPRPIPDGEFKVPVVIRIKKRSKMRRAVVRGPVLKVMLGRQLAGPTKQALKKRALGEDIGLGGVPKIEVPTDEGSSIPHVRTMDGSMAVEDRPSPARRKRRRINTQRDVSLRPATSPAQVYTRLGLHNWAL